MSEKRIRYSFLDSLLKKNIEGLRTFGTVDFEGHFYITDMEGFSKVSKFNSFISKEMNELSYETKKFRVVGINRGEGRRFSFQESDLIRKPPDIFFREEILVYEFGNTGDWNFSNYFDSGEHASDRVDRPSYTECTVRNPYFMLIPRDVNLDSTLFTTVGRLPIGMWK